MAESLSHISQVWLPGIRSLARRRIPGQLVIQMTDSCNARCPQCEMRVTNDYARSRLCVDAIEEVLEKAAERGVAAVSFTGGEPFLRTGDLVRMIQRAGDLGIPLIRTGTNGYFLRNHERRDFRSRVAELASRLACTKLRNLWFSIDSADPGAHDRMRGLAGLFEGIARAVPIFEEHGIWPTANLGVNRHTGGGVLRLRDERSEDAREEFHEDCLAAVRRFYDTVIDAGFTIVNFCYPMSVESAPDSRLGAIYRASSADDSVSFSRREKALLFSAMSTAVAEYRGRIRIFTPRSMLHALVRHYDEGEPHRYACRGGKDFFYINSADGNAYPCGFRAGDNLGRYQAPAFRSENESEICTRCDWECFRDPSTVLGPLLELRCNPLKLLGGLRRDPRWARLWWSDFRYQAAAEFCNGRRPPAFPDMGRFAAHTEDAAPAFAGAGSTH